MTTDELRAFLQPLWPGGLSRGQCAVTALVVQDIFGGILLRGLVCGQSHYWNLLPDGREVDLTRDQFDSFDVKDIQPRDRDYVLSYPDTVRRYSELKTAVRKMDKGVAK